MSLPRNNLQTHQISAISRLFSTSLIRELARKGRSAQLARLAKESTLLDELSFSDPLSKLFDSAFTLLRQRNYRHEYIYKAALTNKVLLGTHSLQTAVMLNEFRAGQCKADSVILNGTSSVYEIKSERDSLSRLEQQISSYRKVFSKVNIITGKNHLASVHAMVPHDVGILVLSDRFQISTVRESVDCPERTIPEAIFDSIQQKEAKKILELLDVDIPRVPNTQMHKALRKSFEGLEPRSVHDCMVKVLRKTRNQLPLAEFISSLPASVQAAALSIPLRKSDRINLLSAMNAPVKEALTWN